MASSRKFGGRLQHFLGDDIGIDLGTANTLVYVRGKGIVVNEPSVVAVNKRTGQVVAVGMQAKDMLGRTPGHVEAIRPLVDGVISDFEVAQEMLAYFIKKAKGTSRRFMGPRVVVGVPSGVTNVEARAVKDAARDAGARAVYVIEEPMAGAIGARFPIFEPTGTMVIDIGGGTTDIAVISLGGIVRSKNLHVAGDRFNNDIIAYIRNRFKMQIGEKTAEEVKIAVGSLRYENPPRSMAVRGRDLISGLPREETITDEHIREAIDQSIETLVEAVREVLETSPPEVLSDIMVRGIGMFGGGALIPGLAELLTEEMGIRAYVVDDPLTAVVRGTGFILEDVEHYQEAFIDAGDD